VSTAVTVATAAAVVIVAAPAAITVAVVVATITVDAAGNAVGGGGGAELMGLALSCAKSLWRPAAPPYQQRGYLRTYGGDIFDRVWWRYLMAY
jgi:hypothetical protein